ncbi:DUF2971 domain-containing protein [Paraburkholderia sp. NPDC080076]|uniref:DUF2971 domain-containing protein n=1 Tax=Paraburkholderia sp. NPDC080076 TaxID=3390605 RepID=UPI003D076228
MTGVIDYSEFFKPLWTEGVQTEGQYPGARPFIAHYCSVSTLEAIVRNEEMWFSNPLYMNDFEELTFGIWHSKTKFRESEPLRMAFGATERYAVFRQHLDDIYAQFESGLAFDVYIACFSEHDPADDDGLLSMWRGYGANGGGVAMIFNMAALTEVPDSPLKIAKITYGTTEERLGWMDQIINRFASLVASASIPDDDLFLCATYLFERLLTLSIFTKHSGFKEEKEWRIVYSKHYDSNNVLTGMLGYFINGGMVEPKLKFKIAPIPGTAEGGITLEQFVSKIILGPRNASPRSKMALQRMLQMLGKPALAERVVTSSTPYRER